MIIGTLSNVPSYVTNSEIHQHLNMKTLAEEVHDTTLKYHSNLETHPNELAVYLTMRNYTKRLKRKDILML